MKRLPIRLRLTVWYLVVFSVALAAFGISVWVLVRQRLYSEAHEQLLSRVASVQHFMVAQGENSTADHMVRELKEEYDAEDEGTWLQIRGEDGQWLYRSRAISEAFPDLKLPQELTGKMKVHSAHVGHDRLRLIAVPITVYGRQYTVETAVVTNGAHHTLENLETVFFLLAPGFIVIAAVGSYYMSRRALATVDEITAMARSIHDRNLDSRLPSLRTNDELQRLSDTLNEMLSRIESSFKRTRQFTADASHELRTPLSLIRTEAELALRKPRSEEEYRNALSQILAESERTTELIEKLLTLARTDSGIEELQLHPLRVVSFLRDITDGWQPLFAESELRFETKLPTTDVLANADESSLRRLLNILLDNARKYTPAGGSITLGADIEASWINVWVTDTGVGIDAQHLPRIFDRFYRVDKARSRSQGGAGLGLSLAKWIAAQHHTSITVDSVPDKGSTFAFRLETVAANGCAPRAEQSASDTTAERIV
jgi:heavy metal sensor kinase